MYTMKDFIKKKIAVSFANRAERIEFLKMCQKAGLRWRGGMLPLDSFAINSGLDGHQIVCGYRDKRDKELTHSTAECHKNEGWKIVPFSKFQREETIGVIKRNGNAITVHMGDLHGTAKCSQDDEFDLYTGCELALRRALGAENKEPETTVYRSRFETGKRYKVSVKAATNNKASIFYRKKNIPNWILEHDGEEVSVNNTRDATADGLLFSAAWCEEIQEPEKPAEPEKPKYYNGKMVCVENGVFNWWTVGKIYEYKDGIVTADDGTRYPKHGYAPYRDAEDAKHPGSLDYTRHDPYVTMLEIKEAGKPDNPEKAKTLAN